MHISVAPDNIFCFYFLIRNSFKICILKTIVAFSVYSKSNVFEYFKLLYLVISPFQSNMKHSHLIAKPRKEIHVYSPPFLHNDRGKGTLQIVNTNKDRFI